MGTRISSSLMGNLSQMQTLPICSILLLFFLLFFTLGDLNFTITFPWGLFQGIFNGMQNS